MQAVAIRLEPGQDLVRQIDQFIQSRQILAGCILTCVGSLTRACLRLANQKEPTFFSGHFEIVSLTGAMSVAGGHYHMSISDEKGQTVGGHVMEGCIVYTTAEIVIGILPDLHFKRTFDPKTGYPELDIEHLH